MHSYMSFGLNVSKLLGFIIYLVLKFCKSAKLMLLVVTENSTVATYPFSLSSTDYLVRFVMNFTYHSHISMFFKKEFTLLFIPLSL